MELLNETQIQLLKLQESKEGKNARTILFLSGIEYKCIVCSKGHPLHAHHKDGWRSNNKLDNLEFRCPSCHVRAHSGPWYSNGLGREKKMMYRTMRGAKVRFFTV